MSVARGDGALLALTRLKLRGALRRQWRKLGEPKGALLGVLGLALVGLWLTAVLFSFHGGSRRVDLGVDVGRLLETCLFGLFLLSVVAGFGNPGVYLPAADVERLLAAPVSRSALLRHRMLVQAARALPGLAIFGLLFARRIPDVAAGALGMALASFAVVVVQQGSSLLAVWTRRRPVLRWAPYAVCAAAIAYVSGVVYGAFEATRDAARALDAAFADAGFRALLSPAAPFARVALAPDLASALPIAAVTALGLAAAVVALQALRIDFREASLATSERVELARQRLRRGTFTATARPGAKLRRAPWWAGRGPAGAVVWYASNAFVRRAPTALLVAVGTLGLAFALSMAGRGDRAAAVPGAALIAVLGTFYLSSTLRVDLRQEIDRLEQWKAAPLAPRRLFLALIAPQWAVVSVLVVGTIALRIACAPTERLEGACIAVLVPLVLAVWIALDNAFFLFWPVRMLPGPGGSLQHLGRSSLLLLVRFGATAVVAAFAALAFAVTYGLAGGERAAPALAAGVLAAALVLAVGAWGAVWLGGRAFVAYDPARDEPD